MASGPSRRCDASREAGPIRLPGAVPLSTKRCNNETHEGSPMTRIFQVMTTLALLVVPAPMPGWAQGQPTPKYSAKVPPYITTPDTVQTRIGTLKFFDGLPDPETVQKVYDNLDFPRGVEAFLSGIPAASLYAACEGLSQAGVKRNSGIGIFQDLMDARSLFLTANSTRSMSSVLGPQGWTDGRRSAARCSRSGRRCLFPLGDRRGTDRPRQGQGRQVFVRSAGLHRNRSIGRLFRRKAANLQQFGFLSRLRQRRGHRRRREWRQGQRAGLSVVRRQQSAGASVRRSIGRAVQHDPRQQFPFLRRDQRRDPARAGRCL